MYRDRIEAGARLSSLLVPYADPSSIVLAIPRGGVVVASEICRRFGIPMDLLISRKIGAPGNPELAVAAVDPDGEIIWEDDRLAYMGIPTAYIQKQAEIERKEILRRLQRYRGDVPMPELKDKTVIVVDDGIATGLTMKASLRWIRKRQPKFTVLAVPVAPPDVAESISKECDALICPLKPKFFYAVGQFYEVFGQTSDEEVVALLCANNPDFAEGE
ncbi:MAG TPA: phosphoribosyltransferase [Clostridia bacterium]|nr:phosphoribosyltransferase [Clostridia bacterium]